MRLDSSLRHYVKEVADRIKHWNPCKSARGDPAHSLEAASLADREITPVHQADAYQKRQYRLEVRRYIRERREADCQRCLEFLTLVAVGIYAAITFWLAVTARQQLTYSERPWVGAGPIDIAAKPTAGQPLNVRITIFNSGKSPALHMLASEVLNPIILPAGDLRVPFLDDFHIADCVKRKTKWSDDLGGSIILPGATNQGLSLSSSILNQTIVDIITQKVPTISVQSEGLKSLPYLAAPEITHNWEVGLYLVGCFNYFDEFHEPHRSAFCYFYIPATSPAFPNGSFGSCPRGNNAD
jgi:hypothetical protein